MRGLWLWLGGEGEVVGLESGFVEFGVGGGCEEGDEGGEGRAAAEGGTEHGWLRLAKWVGAPGG